MVVIVRHWGRFCAVGLARRCTARFANVHIVRLMDEASNQWESSCSENHRLEMIVAFAPSGECFYNRANDIQTSSRHQEAH
jgi:hypothetical protein